MEYSKVFQSIFDSSNRYFTKQSSGGPENRETSILNLSKSKCRGDLRSSHGGGYHSRASTRVSSGFTLFRHSSPSFGSQQTRSYSNLPKSRIGRSTMRPATRVGISPQRPKPSSLSFCLWVSSTLRLAHMLDSLVRVSRRVGWTHMTANVLSTWYEITTPTTGSSRRALQAVHRIRQPAGRTGP